MWKLEEEEKLKMEFERWKKEHQEAKQKEQDDWKRQTETNLRKQITEELTAKAEKQPDETIANLVRQALRQDPGSV